MSSSHTQSGDNSKRANLFVKNRASSSMVILTDVSQLEVSSGELSQVTRGKHLVTSDITVAEALESRGIPFIDEWNFLDVSDILDNEKIADDLAQNWWCDYLSEIEYPRGFPLASATYQDMVPPLQVCLNARTIYDRMLNSAIVDHLYGFFLPQVGMFRSGASAVIQGSYKTRQAQVERCLQEMVMSMTQVCIKDVRE